MCVLPHVPMGSLSMEYSSRSAPAPSTGTHSGSRPPRAAGPDTVLDMRLPFTVSATRATGTATPFMPMPRTSVTWTLPTRRRRLQQPRYQDWMMRLACLTSRKLRRVKELRQVATITCTIHSTH